MQLVPKRCVRCHRCGSENVRVSEVRTFRDFVRGLIGFRALRCNRCLTRFCAFAPVLQEEEPPKRTLTHYPVVDREAHFDSHSPLLEIREIEAEWRRRLQPEGMVEETLCAQLAHATWHLRTLHRAEREAIAVAVRDRCFNGEEAVSLMTWRRSAEIAIQTALDQLHRYRQLQPDERPLVESSELLALAHAVGGAPSTAPVESRSPSLW